MIEHSSPTDWLTCGREWLKQALKQVYIKLAADYPREGLRPSRQVEPVLGVIL